MRSYCDCVACANFHLTVQLRLRHARQLPLGRANPSYQWDLYGTTAEVGISTGTVFKITPSGTLTTIYHFCSKSDCQDGYAPYAGLVQGGDGNFYGTTTQGGANFDGTIFKITPSGELTALHTFDSPDSAGSAGLIQATNGYFYGTTDFGGANSQGSVFKMSPSGKL